MIGRRRLRGQQGGDRRPRVPRGGRDGPGAVLPAALDEQAAPQGGSRPRWREEAKDGRPGATAGRTRPRVTARAPSHRRAGLAPAGVTSHGRAAGGTRPGRTGAGPRMSGWEQHQLTHLPRGGMPITAATSARRRPPARVRGHRQRPDLALARCAGHLAAGPVHQHHRAEDVPVVHGGQDLAGAVRPERAHRGRVPGGGRQEPVRPVGGDPQFADGQLLRLGVTYVHARPNPPGGSRIPHHRRLDPACDGRPVIG